MPETATIPAPPEIAPGPVVSPDLAAELFGAVNRRAHKTEQRVAAGPTTPADFAEQYPGWETLSVQAGWNKGPLEKVAARRQRQQELQAQIDATAGLGINEDTLRAFDERMVGHEEHPDEKASRRAKGRWNKNRTAVVRSLGADNFTQDKLSESFVVNGDAKSKLEWLKQGAAAAKQMASLREQGAFIGKDLLDQLDGDMGLLMVAERNQRLMQAIEQKLAKDMRDAGVHLMSAKDKAAFLKSMSAEYGNLKMLRVHGVDLTKRVADLCKGQLQGMGEQPLELIKQYTQAHLERIGDGGEVAVRDRSEVLQPDVVEARYLDLVKEIEDGVVSGIQLEMTDEMKDKLRVRLGFVKKEGGVWELSEKSILANRMMSEARSDDIHTALQATIGKLTDNPELFDRAYYLLQHSSLVDGLQILSAVGVTSEALDLVGDQTLDMLKAAGLEEQAVNLAEQLKQLRGSEEILAARAKMTGTVHEMLDKVGISLKGIDYKKGLKYAAIGVGIMALLSLLLGVTFASSVVSGMGGGR